MTAHAEVSGAVAAMKLGAVDYLAKPVNPAELAMIIARARRSRQSARLEEQRRENSRQAGEIFFFGQALAGNVEAVFRVIEQASRQRLASDPVVGQQRVGYFLEDPCFRGIKRFAIGFTPRRGGGSLFLARFRGFVG